MHATVMAPGKLRGRAGQIAIEVEMLELFAPLATPGKDESARRSDNAPLWRSDAIHRAKNLAQLMSSLASVATHPSREWLAADLVAQSRSLARAYEELGMEHEQADFVPCVSLLTEIATRLTLIFGNARGITITVAADPVSLVPDMRRALVLMCSEMIINALKYGFPADAGGSILVKLTNKGGEVALVVEDDGAGRVADYSAGQGSRLLAQLGGVLGASVIRSPGIEGRGSRVMALLRANDAVRGEA